MQSIIDAIEQWLKDFLIGAITGNLSSMFSDVNSKVATIATEVGKTPESWNSSVFSIILTLSKNVVVPIAGLVIAAVLTYELISMIIEKNNMHDIDTFMFFKWAFKSAAAAIIVNHTFDFIMAVFQVAQTMVQRSAGVIDTNASIDISSAIANITTELQATGLGDLFALMLETWVVSFAMKAMGLIITVILYGRMIEIYIYASVGPLPFATFMNREWGNIGTNYVRGLAALGLQGFLIMICVGIYAVLVNALSLGGDLQASIWSCAAYTVLALNPQGDQFDEIRKEYSDMLVRQVSKSRYERRICLTYTIEADGIRQARSRLEQIDNDVVGHFRALTVAAHPMDGYERLTILHRCLHLEENRKFRFNWDSLKHTGLSSKDYIAPSSFFFKDGRYFRSGASFGAVSFLQIRATKLYDTLLNSILNMEGSQIVSIHAKALDQNAALKAVKRKLSDLDKAKIDEQKRAVRSGFDMDILPPDLVTFGKEAQKLLEDLQNHDEKMFMVTILVVHAASSRQKLENLIYSANGITNTQNCDLIRLDYQQEQGFVSALPIGINQVEIQRGLTTSGTAIFLPFRACEVFQPKGVYYGLNATTNRMILADRKTLKCPNGVVLGTPGSGKSFSCKREAADVYLHTTDDILFLDPENEYTSLCQQLSGQVIRLAPDSHDYINPLDVDLTTNTGENPLLMKADFIMSFCELILSAAQGGLKPIEKSVIDRCIPKIYRQLIKDPRPENMPILGDLYECLRAQQEEQAQELATALELYVFGSLNYLNHRTNVNVDNRVACYDISGLGQNLKKPGMLTVQNNIWQRTTVNRYAGKTTRIYLDEFHLLLKEPQTAAYTAEIYKRFRKWNGIPTALTQNVKDLLESPEIENILENSDFILMLNQAASDRNILAQRLGISPQELGHITNSDAGEGLLFFGDKIIPFVDKFPTDTKLYQVMTTKPADLAA